LQCRKHVMGFTVMRAHGLGAGIGLVAIRVVGDVLCR
jgi:hypothetical protein